MCFENSDFKPKEFTYNLNTFNSNVKLNEIINITSLKKKGERFQCHYIRTH